MENRLLNLLLFLLVLSILFGGWFYKQNQVRRAEIKQSQFDLSRMETLYHILYNNQGSQYSAESLSLDGAIKVANIDNRMLLFHDIIDQFPVLIFRFSETSCQICIEQELAYIKQVWDYYGSESAILLCDFTSFGAFRSFVKANQLLKCLLSSIDN